VNVRTGAQSQRRSGFRDTEKILYLARLCEECHRAGKEDGPDRGGSTGLTARRCPPALGAAGGVSGRSASERADFRGDGVDVGCTAGRVDRGPEGALSAEDG